LNFEAKLEFVYVQNPITLNFYDELNTFHASI